MGSSEPAALSSFAPTFRLVSDDLSIGLPAPLLPPTGILSPMANRSPGEPGTGDTTLAELMRGNLEFLSGEFDFPQDVQQSDGGEIAEDHALQNFRVSVFAPPVSNTTPARDVGWQELCRMLGEDVVVLPNNSAETKARSGQYFVRGKITGTRNDANLSGCCVLIIDIDKPLPGCTLPTTHEIHDALGDIVHAVYSSATAGRSRIVVPVPEYPPEETAARTKALYDFARSLGLEFAYAGESKTASQPWFYGQTLAKENHICLVNNDGEIFRWEEVPEPEPEAEPKQERHNGTDQKAVNHLQKLIDELKSGTIHVAAKEWAGWQCRTTNLTKRQIFDDLTVLIEAHCSDRDKVARWYSRERAELEGWFTLNVQAPDPAPVLMTSAECQTDSNLSLQIPEHVLDPGGLISLGMEALSAPGMSGIPQYGLPAVLAHIANALAGRVVFRGVHPNLYNVKIGPTSTGKSEGDKAMVKAIREHVTGFYGPSDFASGPALLRALADNPRCMIVIDEGTSLFRRSGKADTVADGKREALLELYSASGGIIEKAYSDKKNNIIIDCPCFSLTANATPALFESIEHQDFVTGILQRFDFWCYDGPAPRRTRANSDENRPLAAFAEGIAAIRAAIPGSTPGNMVGVLPGSPVALAIDPQADDRLQQWSDTVIDRVNAVDDDGSRGIMSRSYDLGIKYAMVHWAATRVTGGALALSAADIEYGIAVAWMLAGWKINRLRNRVTCGDFDRDCELFKESIRRAVGADRRPTMKVLVDRCRPLKNFPMSYLDQIIKTLTDRGEVIADTAKRPIAYHLVKI